MLGVEQARATGMVNPDRPAEPILTGASDDLMRRLAADVLARSGRPVREPALAEGATS